MTTLDCSLVSEGSSDTALLPIIRWAVAQHAHGAAVEAVWADLRRLRRRSCTLAEKILAALELYPCDILFVHRDADAQPPAWRKVEIDRAVAAAKAGGLCVPYVCVIPVRMQEAWLLLDAAAVRRAAGNPNGAVTLPLPAPHRIETHPDPKALLYESLRAASELRGRRLKRFRPEERAPRVSSHMTSFCPLRALPAFRRLEDEIRSTIATLDAPAPS